MNRHCYGHVYRIDGTVYLRCFGDARAPITLENGQIPATCPGCQRPLEATDLGQAQRRLVSRVEVYIPSLRNYVFHSEITTPVEPTPAELTS